MKNIYRKGFLQIILFSFLSIGLAACQAADDLPLPTKTIPPAPQLATSTATPQPVTPAATPTVESTQTAVSLSPTPDYPFYDGPPLDRSQIGVQVHLHGEDIDVLATHLTQLNVGWVKVQVSWKVFQPEPDRLDEFWFAELEQLLTAAERDDIQVMVGIAKAPEWSRPTTEFDGPPSNPADFVRFMTLFATRYQGRVRAYELWNETNLQREWNGGELNGGALVELIAVGSSAVRAADPAALVLSGAPAPTGINDGVTAVDDRVYFQQMVNAGVAQYVDGFGIHPYGWANPPLSNMINPDPSTRSHNDHPSFFFLSTLNDYYDILDAAGVNVAEQQLWATEFGWGSFDEIGQPVAGTEFMNDVTEWQQARYLLDALAYGQTERFMGPMMLWNLNFAPLLGTDFSESGYSLLRVDGSPRPSYRALQTALQQEQTQ